MLVVAADLRCHVRAPDGATATVSLRGGDGAPLVLDVDGSRALWRSLPRGRGSASSFRAGQAALVRLVPVQVREDLRRAPVDVVLDGRRVASRRDGRWRPAPGPAVAAAVATLGVVGVVSALIGVAGVAAARALARGRVR
ncbi:hypothetical protein [Aquipuribacter sp. SD81]|uniref:hypothetical protein n=1 Tax=Aquipuribacter sp. SD81 TaxID=3127703 RepID=UPI00301942E8